MKVETVMTDDGPMDVHVAAPEAPGPHPAVVVMQEAFGVNRHIVDVCERLAREGFVAVAPDLFHRAGRGLTFGYDEFPKLRPFFAALTNDGIALDARAAIALLRARPDVRADRVGVTGFCVGGFAALLVAERTDVAAAVAFYGGGMVNARPGLRISPPLAAAEEIRAPMLFFFGSDDASIPPSDVDAVREKLTALGKTFEIVVYAGAGHGFFCDERASFAPEAAADAWTRTLSFFRQHLG